MDRKGLCIRRKTNNKKQSVFEKLHKIKNYHHYTVYELADDDISSASSDSECEDDSEDLEPEDDSEDSSSELITSDDDSSSESE